MAQARQEGEIDVLALRRVRPFWNFPFARGAERSGDLLVYLPAVVIEETVVSLWQQGRLWLFLTYS